MLPGLYSLGFVALFLTVRGFVDAASEPTAKGTIYGHEGNHSGGQHRDFRTATPKGALGLNVGPHFNKVQIVPFRPLPPGQQCDQL